MKKIFGPLYLHDSVSNPAHEFHGPGDYMFDGCFEMMKEENILTLKSGDIIWIIDAYQGYQDRRAYDGFTACEVVKIRNTGGISKMVHTEMGGTVSREFITNGDTKCYRIVDRKKLLAILKANPSFIIRSKKMRPD